ncbi:hypothetical protein [Xenorhabdus bovienii]|uniref:Uncharacterized protein n=1 Tax=Xenorhabdus bovienii str. feltiae Moldova TaxID=1398200 RepID=A0A077NTM5_XENBV|nr:hypothetical protein [Xenorhabdus bovienii]CDH00931.1 conserved hypothetical protein [Xenorhabdus bovienii str. feltiae Moldova]
MTIPEIDVLKLFASQGVATPSAVALSIFGLDPYMSVTNTPEAYLKNVHNIRRAIVSNVNALSLFRDKKANTNTDIDSDIVFGAAYQCLSLVEGVPEIIASRIEQALDNIYKEHKKNGGWEEYIKVFGGRALVEKMALQNKKGQGQYRKNDEQKGTYKLIGLLVLLLQEKSIKGCQPSNNYGSIGSPIKQRIYDDIKQLVDDMKKKDFLVGVERSTFYNKLRDADYYLNGQDE